MRKRLVEVHSLAEAVCEKLSTVPGLPSGAQALADLTEEHAERALGDSDRICAALDAITK